MDNFACIPTRLHWTAQQLTDAVPLRLHQLYGFAADGAAQGHAANGERDRRRPHRAYAPSPVLPPRFRIG